MNRTQLPYLATLIVISLFCSCNEGVKRDLYPQELVAGFNLLSKEQTGIDFKNTINESTFFNHYYYSQIYVGSGVAIGDINNDGLPDVFFGGNQVADRLYLNKGDLKFEDITKTSKVAKNSGWTWGVTMADVNADGYLDIYVSRNGNSEKTEDRRNQLYINNQDLTFTESAQKYGLADVGFSTQAAFFDMDNDGDLDMYQVNQVADKKLLLLNKIPRDQFKFFRDHLYRNDNGKFVDVSEKSGITRDVAYGLSVNATDFNGDGWMDLYIANDYAEPDFMYYNNGDGTFRNVINEELKHITQLSMGSDTGDINNDGLLDLITTDMTPEDHYRSKTNMASMSTETFNTLVEAGAHRQYMANTLQINTGLGSFSDIGNMAGMAYTDWSWASLIVDLDNDGLKDVIISNGIKKDVDNNDYRNKVKSLGPGATAEDLFQLSKDTPSQPLSNYAFRNIGDLQFEKITKDWGFDSPSFSNGMAYGDLDNDGDLDVITNNIDAAAFVYENKTNGNFLKINAEGPSKNKFGIGAKALVYYEGKKQIVENTVTRGFISSVDYGMFFGLGKTTKVDKVEVLWPDGKVNVFNDISANMTITAKYADANFIKNNSTNSNKKLFTTVDSKSIGIDFKHIENEYDEFTEEILLPHNVSQNGPFTSVGDVNGDGLKDVFIGGSVGQSGLLYVQDIHGNYVKAESQPWDGDKNAEDLGSLFLDVDNDNDLDLYVTSGGSEYKIGNPLLKDRLYINNGRGNFTKNQSAIPDIRQSTQVVRGADIDNDGDMDLFIGSRLIPGAYTFPASSYFLINDEGKFKMASKELAPALIDLGMVTDAVFTDIDNDNDEDLMIVGEWMEIKVLSNDDGLFTDNSADFGLRDTRGMWWSVTVSDLDNDGDDDYILGNLGKNNKFKASKEHPFKVYANDFDNNGTNDVVLAKFYKDDYVPLRGRECTSQQMPYVAEKFEDYHSFASSKLIDILPEEKVDDAVIYEIKSFASIILLNENGKLVKKELPNSAQIAPIKSIITIDVNRDGFKDILTVGNHYGVEVETTRYDAGHGALIMNDGNSNFRAIAPIESGFYIPYDSRDIEIIEQKNRSLLLITNNNDNPSIFEFNR
ncbi:MAG: VCBS repeat-containing protein [Winogradskyella sp.]|uniref:VCBS repeat-containing protein n=1 Tax=Winogradskyella sp. TaxID=1883156 RepID=UPI0017C7AC05|nr:VCBS repeat-containing protein [Winogradskyella sp.]